MEENLLIKAVQVVDPAGPHHGEITDVRIANGVIVEIGQDISSNGATVWSSPGTFISPGWVDGQAHFRDPGEEVKEGLESGALAAQNGGFTDVALLPTTDPVLDHKAEIHYLLRRAQGGAVDIHPIGALSSKLAGKNLAELHDLRAAGAVGFYDDGPVDHPEMLRRGLEYAADTGVSVWALPLEERLNPGAVMHEGVTSTQLGLAGSPDIAETMRLHRDLEIVRYTSGRLHVPLLTSAKAVAMMRHAKSEGLHVTCGVSAHHLLFCDEHLNGFQGALRTRTPFRSEADRQALIAGVIDGTIDAIVSDHRPEDLEHNDVEFMLAPEGIAGIESAFSSGFTALGKAQIDSLIHAFTHGPRAVLGLPPVHIAIGEPARITWFDGQSNASTAAISRAVNVPDYPRFLGKGLTGMALGTVRGKQVVKLRPEAH